MDGYYIEIYIYIFMIIELKELEMTLLQILVQQKEMKFKKLVILQQ